MDWKEFINLSTQNIAKNRMEGNKFVDVVKGIFTSNQSGQKEFYKFIPSRTYFDVFVDAVNSVDHSEEDYAPIMHKDYWDRNLDSFAYTARILPALRNKYPKAYKQVFDGQSILEAGINPDFRDRPDVKTIWNIVGRVDKKSDNGQSQKDDSQKNDKINNYKNAPNNKKIEVVQKNLERNYNTKVDDKQASAIVKFINNLLQ